MVQTTNAIAIARDLRDIASSLLALFSVQMLSKLPHTLALGQVPASGHAGALTPFQAKGSNVHGEKLDARHGVSSLDLQSDLSSDSPFVPFVHLGNLGARNRVRS